MHDALKTHRCLVLALAGALLWANFAWALPWNRITEEPESAATEELPAIEYTPLTYAETTYDEVLYEISDIAAAGDSWTCANCGAENPADAKYCSACGTKKGEETAAGLSDVRVCPKCGFVNEKGAKFCGDCGYNFYGAGAATAGIETVYVPGRGYVPKGTMIEPGHARTGMWVTGLVMWLLVGPGVAAAGIVEDSPGLYYFGGIVYLTGEILFIVGIGAKTEPVYAFRPAEDDAPTALALKRKNPESEGFTVKIEVPVLSF